MSVSQRRGVITLVPKEDSNLLSLSNWRPITLLNLDYKTASKVIAKGMEKVLSVLINPDQTGFVKGRYMAGTQKLPLKELSLNEFIIKFTWRYDLEKPYF